MLARVCSVEWTEMDVSDKTVGATLRADHVCEAVEFVRRGCVRAHGTSEYDDLSDHVGIIVAWQTRQARAVSAMHYG